eukprot:3185876-Pyramimonas_sp.AAC.1
MLLGRVRILKLQLQRQKNTNKLSFIVMSLAIRQVWNHVMMTLCGGSREMLVAFQSASCVNFDIMNIMLSRSWLMGGLRAAMSDQLVAESGDARIAPTMTKTSGKLRTGASMSRGH